MSFIPKHLTQGGQMTAYRLRMFVQVNQWISHWIILLFLVATGGLFYAITPGDVLRNGFWYWAARFMGGLPMLSDRQPAANWDVHWHCGDAAQMCTTNMTLPQLLADPWMQMTGQQLVNNLKFVSMGCGIAASVLFCSIIWYVGRIGKKETEDEFISGMTLTDDLKAVNRLLKKAGEKSDLQIGGLNMVKNAEVMNFLFHGTIGVGKSTLIRWLLDYIRRRGDRAIIYDSGGTFIETHYDERRDKILNAHDSRCENWVLWRECPEVVDYENLTAALIPVEGESDPFWVSSSRTIFSDGAMQFAADPERSIEKFLKTLLSIDLSSLRTFLKNTPSANLVEEKIEKTAISIRSVLTNYAKALRYLQGLDKEGKPEFSIREWMTDARYDNSWLFISTTARHRKAVRPLISMWLSLATLLLQSMGENSERRVWIIGDEIASLQKIPELNETLAEARKFGGCFVLGIQNIPQLVHIYGREMAKAIFDLLNTRAYGRSPSAEVAKMVEEELGHQRRREAREQNSFGLDQVRDGISLSKDKVNEPLVDYDQVMTMPNLRFYLRLPGEYPVVKLDLKYRKQKKYHAALVPRDFKDRLSPELEKIIRQNERVGAAAGLSFPTGEEILEQNAGKAVPASAAAASPVPVMPAALPGSDVNAKPVPPAKAPVTSLTDQQLSAIQPVTSDKPITVAPPIATTAAPITDLSSLAAPDRNLPGSRPTLTLVRDNAVLPEKSATSAAPVADTPLPPESIHEAPQPVMPSVSQAMKQPMSDHPVCQRQSLSALDLLNRRRQQNATTSTDSTDAPAESAESSGDSPELNMEMEVNDKGELLLRTAGTPRAPDPDSADAQRGGKRASQLMADEELNILLHRQRESEQFNEHHHSDYEHYSNTHHDHSPGDFEQ